MVQSLGWIRMDIGHLDGKRPHSRIRRMNWLESFCKSVFFWVACRMSGIFRYYFAHPQKIQMVWGVIRWARISVDGLQSVRTVWKVSGWSKKIQIPSFFGIGIAVLRTFVAMSRLMRSMWKVFVWKILLSGNLLHFLTLGELSTKKFIF